MTWIHLDDTGRAAWRARPVSMCAATFFGVGHMRGGPGTYTAILVLPLIGWLSHTVSVPVHFGIWAVVTALSIVWSDRAGHALGEDDSRKIVIDEVVGVWFTLVLFDHLTFWQLAVGCTLFRVFDIVKPPPCRVIDQRIHGGFGVILDDLAASVWAGVILWLIVWAVRVVGA